MLNGAIVNSWKEQPSVGRLVDGLVLVLKLNADKVKGVGYATGRHRGQGGP